MTAVANMLKVHPILQPGPLRLKSIQGSCSEGEVAREANVCLSATKYNPTGLGYTRQMGGPGHDHAILTRSELIPRNNMASNRNPKIFSAFKGDSVECNGIGTSP